MKFRTEISVKLDLKEEISPQSNFFASGSCFATEMGKFLEQSYVSVLNNPDGVLYNPLSIWQQLRRVVSGAEYTSDDFIEYEGVFYSCEQAAVKGVDLGCLLKEQNERLAQKRSFLKSAGILQLSFGSQWAYFCQGRIMANCYKLPSRLFQRRFLDSQELIALWQDLIKDLKQWNPKLEVILTVSPLRHLRDTYRDNTLSKASLQLFVDELCQLSGVHYFPAYELMMDDLRDYRFYEQDMTHPNELAKEYIWQKYRQALFKEEYENYFAKAKKLRAMDDHRLIDEVSEASQKFLAKREALRKEMQTDS